MSGQQKDYGSSCKHKFCNTMIKNYRIEGPDTNASPQAEEQVRAKRRRNRNENDPKIGHDTNYYLHDPLLYSEHTLSYCEDAFEPKDFLIYFLIYAWGYVLVLKSDFEYRVGRMEQAIIKLEEQLVRLEQSKEQSVMATEDYGGEEQEEDGDEGQEDDFSPGLSSEHTSPSERRDIYNEW